MKSDHKYLSPVDASMEMWHSGDSDMPHSPLSRASAAEKVHVGGSTLGSAPLGSWVVTEEALPRHGAPVKHCALAFGQSVACSGISHTSTSTGGGGGLTDQSCGTNVAATSWISCVPNRRPNGKDRVLPYDSAFDPALSSERDVKKHKDALPQNTHAQLHVPGSRTVANEVSHLLTMYGRNRSEVPLQPNSLLTHRKTGHSADVLFCKNCLALYNSQSIGRGFAAKLASASLSKSAQSFATTPGRRGSTLTDALSCSEAVQCAGDRCGSPVHRVSVNSTGDSTGHRAFGFDSYYSLYWAVNTTNTLSVSDRANESGCTTRTDEHEKDALELDAEVVARLEEERRQQGGGSALPRCELWHQHVSSQLSKDSSKTASDAGAQWRHLPTGRDPLPNFTDDFLSERCGWCQSLTRPIAARCSSQFSKGASSSGAYAANHAESRDTGGVSSPEQLVLQSSETRMLPCAPHPTPPCSRVVNVVGRSHSTTGDEAVGASIPRAECGKRPCRSASDIQSPNPIMGRGRRGQRMVRRAGALHDVLLECNFLGLKDVVAAVAGMNLPEALALLGVSQKLLVGTCSPEMASAGCHGVVSTSQADETTRRLVTSQEGMNTQEVLACAAVMTDIALAKRAEGKACGQCSAVGRGCPHGCCNETSNAVTPLPTACPTETDELAKVAKSSTHIAPNSSSVLIEKPPPLSVPLGGINATGSTDPSGESLSFLVVATAERDMGSPGELLSCSSSYTDAYDPLEHKVLGGMCGLEEDSGTPEALRAKPALLPWESATISFETVERMPKEMTDATRVVRVAQYPDNLLLDYGGMYCVPLADEVVRPELLERWAACAENSDAMNECMIGATETEVPT